MGPRDKPGKKSGGMLLRLTPDDLEFVSDTMDQIQDLTLKGLDARIVDVLIDCRSLTSIAQTIAMSESASIMIENLATSFRLRKVIVTGSCAPKTVTSIDKNSSGVILRNELSLWANLRFCGALQWMLFTATQASSILISPT